MDRGSWGVTVHGDHKEFLLMWLFLLLLLFRRGADRGQIEKDITHIYHSLSMTILFPQMIFIANLSRLGFGFCLSKLANLFFVVFVI